jgi:hypothetical protein
MFEQVKKSDICKTGSVLKPSSHHKNHKRITLLDYQLIGELMENATFCCLFHEITLST